MRIYNVFIASPGDVERERKLAGKIIEEINRTIGSVSNAEFKPFFWEKDGIPGFGQSAQSFINEQAIDGNKMDCAIFILWHRYGTPVDGAESGWEAELQRFIKQKSTDPSFRILFFVKQAKVCPRKTDLDQLKKVNDFLRGMPGLYAQFVTGEDFKQHLRRSLGDVLRSLEEYEKTHRKVV